MVKKINPRRLGWFKSPVPMVRCLLNHTNSSYFPGISKFLGKISAISRRDLCDLYLSRGSHHSMVNINMKKLTVELSVSVSCTRWMNNVIIVFQHLAVILCFLFTNTLKPLRPLDNFITYETAEAAVQ